MLLAVSQADIVEQLASPGSSSGAGKAGFGHRQLHVFPRGQDWQQMKPLKHKSDPGETHARKLPVVQPSQRDAFELDGAGSGRIDTAEDVKQSGFPAPRWPRDREVLASANRQVHATKSVDGLAVQLVVFANRFGAKEAHGASARRVAAIGALLASQAG